LSEQKHFVLSQNAGAQILFWLPHSGSARFRGVGRNGGSSAKNHSLFPNHFLELKWQNL
jgi:hypothetical protein